MTASVSVVQAANAADKDKAMALTLQAIQADLAALQAQYAGLLLKLDADAGVTDVDYHTNAATKAPTLLTLA